MTMLTIEAVATLSDDGILTVKLPRPVPVGRHRVVVIIDDENVSAIHGGLPSLAAFRSSLGASSYPGNGVLEGRDGERA